MPGLTGGRGARARILDTAARLFASRGINGVGVAELAAAAPVSKRTLYQHFPSKEELVRVYLSGLGEPRVGSPEAVLTRTELAPRARLLELFTALSEQPHPLRGSPLVNAAVALPDPAAPEHRAVAGHHRRFTEQLADLARAAGARDPELVGRRLALLYDGACARMLVENSAQAAGDAYAMAAGVLRQSIDERS